MSKKIPFLLTFIIHYEVKINKFKVKVHPVGSTVGPSTGRLTARTKHPFNPGPGTAEGKKQHNTTCRDSLLVPEGLTLLHSPSKTYPPPSSAPGTGQCRPYTHNLDSQSAQSPGETFSSLREPLKPS